MPKRVLVAVKRLPWELSSRVSLMLALIGPALFLLLQSQKFAHSGLLNAVSWLLPVWVFGIVMLIAGILIFWLKTREWGYLIGMIVYGVFSACGIITMLSGHVFSPLLLCMPAVSMFFAEAMRDALQRHRG